MNPYQTASLAISVNLASNLKIKIAPYHLLIRLTVMTDQPSLSRFFIAIVPPEPIQDYATQLMQMLGDRYQMRASQSPPHVTLYAPFQWSTGDRSALESALQAFTQNQPVIPMRLSGFNAFRPRVLYVHVEQTPELLNLHTHLMDHLEAALGLIDPVARRRPFTPHLTLASRNVTPKTLRLAWEDLQPHASAFDFESDRLTLLQHKGDRWHIQSDHLFMGTS